MMIHDITEQVGRHKRRKRIGRGPGSGTGKTAGRGHNGYSSRSGNSNPHQGGGSPMYVRFPKRGFNNYNFETVYSVVNIKALDARFDDGAEINPEMLVKHGLVRSTKLPIKILGHGETTKKFTITAARFTESAKEKLEKAGGSVTATA